MAKDPAINWYFDNWIGGTKGFNRFQKGCYFDILTLQYYCGPLSLDQIKNELGQDFHVWETIKRKFITDECGNYYNGRLAAEIRKREKYSESRRQNRAKKTHDESYVKDMINTCGNIPEIEIETDIGFKDEGTGETMKGDSWNITIDLVLPAVTLEAVQRNQFTHTRNENTAYVQEQWKVFLSERMNDPPEKKRQYRQIEDLTSYFINWMRNKFPKKHAGSTPQSRREKSDASASWLLNSLRDDITATGG